MRSGLSLQKLNGLKKKYDMNMARPSKRGRVEEYILIGEADDGTCGHNWYTWGNFDFHTEDDNEVLRSRKTPYEMDGYIRVDLKDLSMLQFSRFDCKRSSESMTVSFRHERRKS